MSRSRVLKLMSVFTALGVAACGGGGDGGSGGNGGGGGGGGGGGSGEARNLTLTLSTDTVDFLAVANGVGAPGPQRISGTVSGNANGTLYVLISSSNPAVATVGAITMGSTSASADVIAADISTLGPGLHTATITVRACLNDSTCASNQVTGSPQSVTVNYRINGTLASTSALSYDIGNTIAAGDLSRSFTIRAHPAQGWTATTDVPMLRVSPITGGTASSTAVTADIDEAALDIYEGGTYTGSIRFTPNAVTQVPFDLPVTVNITRTRVNFVAPHVAIAGRTAEVIIRGEYFDAAPPTAVRFGDTSATSFTVVSPTEIRATHPALAAGEYPVHVDNAQGIDRTKAILHVVPGGALPAASLDYPDGDGAWVLGLIHDARRGALLAHLFYNYPGATTSRLVRFANANGTWQQTGSVELPHRSAIALSANGDAIFVGHQASQSFAVDERDPVTLAVARSTLADRSFHEAFSMAVANDGNALIETNSTSYSSSFHELLFSPLRRTVRPMIRPGGRVTTPPMLQFAGFTAASGDGSTVLIADKQYQLTVRYVSGDLETRWFDPTLQNQPYFSSLAMNRRGTLLGGLDGVYDQDFSRIGRLPVSTIKVGVSPEQPRAYTVDQNGTLRVFDTSAPAVDGYLVEVTPALALLADPDAQSDGVPIAISPDGATAFVAGREGIVVVPLQ